MWQRFTPLNEGKLIDILLQSAIPKLLKTIVSFSVIIHPYCLSPDLIFVIS